VSAASVDTGPHTGAAGILTGRFGAWLAAETVSATGDGVLFFAIAWTASGLGARTAGVILTLGLLPSAVLSVVGGALADRWGLRRTIIGANLATCLLLGLFLGLEATGVPTALLLGGLAVADGLVNAVQRPANSAFPRLFFRDESLSRGMSLTGAVLQVARLAGPPLGGVVVAALTMDGAVGADLISFLAILAVLALVRPPYEPPPETAEDGSSTLRRASAAVAAAVRVPGAIGMLCTVAVVAGSLLPMLSLCVPLLVRDRQWGAGTAGGIEACWVAGSLALSLLIAKLGTRSRAAGPLVGGPMLSAAGIVAVSLAPSPPVAYAGSAVMGVGTIAFTAHAFPLYIRLTPPGMLARFQAMLLVAQYLPTLIGNTVLGVVAAGSGPRATMWLLAASCAGAGVLVLARRPLRHARL
jgi:hypothetical protein